LLDGKGYLQSKQLLVDVFEERHGIQFK